MRSPSNLFLIDGVPMLAPDADMEVSYEDLDSSASGRDEAGVMHRLVLRHQVGKWSFIYDCLTRQEYAYMEGLFAGKSHFQFTFPSPTSPNQTQTVTAYRSQHGIGWRCVQTGQFRNYKFNIIAC